MREALAAQQSEAVASVVDGVADGVGAYLATVSAVCKDYVYKTIPRYHEEQMSHRGGRPLCVGTDCVRCASLHFHGRG